MPKQFTTLTLEIIHGIAHVRLDRPERGNSTDGETARDLLALAETLEADGSVRVILLGANGPTFTRGGDITVFSQIEAADLAATLGEMIDPFHQALQRLVALDAPIVAAVRGAAAGGGLGLVCVADIVVAADDSMFALGSAAIGLTADGGTSWFLPRLVGMRRAQELMLLNRRLTAAEALDWGLITRVVPSDDVEAHALSLAEALAVGPTVAYGGMRSLLAVSFQQDFAQQLELERQTVMHSAATADAPEGIAAFAERRRATFVGR